MFRILGVLSLVTLLAACGGSGGDGGAPAPTPTPAPTSAGDVVVTVTPGAQPVPPGIDAVFTATVTNTGPQAVQDIVLQHALTAGYTATFTCAAAGGAACPAALGASMNVASLPVNGSLTFTIGVPTTGAPLGNVVSTLQASASGDTSSANNSASAVVAVSSDPRSGTYLAYATDARVYRLTVNFSSNAYLLSGNGLDSQGSFTPDGSGTYTIGGNAKFRTATDLLVGGIDFGSGVRSFVAARSFVTSTTQLTHTMNGLGINLTGTTPSASRIFSSRFTGGTLQSCTHNVIYTIAACPAASVFTYALSVNGTEITGVDAANNDTIKFRVARSGNLLIYLRAEVTPAGVPSFRIGLPDTNGLAGGSFTGASVLGSWGTTTLTNTQYSVSGTLAGGAALSDSAVLGALGSSQPTGIRVGNRASDNAALFVIQGSPLAVAVGQNSGAVAGYIEIGLQ